jgi:hypothetical protein
MGHTGIRDGIKELVHDWDEQKLSAAAISLAHFFLVAEDETLRCYVLGRDAV